MGGVCANFAARPVFHHGAPCVAAANGARRSLPMASTACVSPSASLRLPLPHGCQDIFTDTRSACLSGFQGSIPLPAQTAKGGSLKACPERSRTDPQDLGMDRLAEAFPYGCATPIRHPQSSVALRFEAATHMPRYFHTHQWECRTPPARSVVLLSCRDRLRHVMQQCPWAVAGTPGQIHPTLPEERKCFLYPAGRPGKMPSGGGVCAMRSGTNRWFIVVSQ